jgi:hypothetical protein
MNAQDPFEAELRRVKPAAPPQDFLLRLRATHLSPRTRRTFVHDSAPIGLWRFLLRWVVPATAAVVVGVVVWRAGFPVGPGVSKFERGTIASTPGLNANDVEIDRELVGSFDAVARLPGGEPVRFRCQEWVDQVVWRDRERGVLVEQRTPRMEIVPVRYETY